MSLLTMFVTHTTQDNSSARYREQHRQRVYRRRVRQCLWFVLNLYHPNGPPPCDEAIKRRFQHFLAIPIPRTPEELEAQRQAVQATTAKPKRIVKRRVVVVVKRRRSSAHLQPSTTAGKEEERTI
ncbi:uncharacterized protein LOC128307424 [Anopheles moucheti]|uniref:uncharacterized protein LOC128307424 n=1 Tax=Anopheles moucheti TaxID=186751 RepID=UPI0022F05774|nr:uncharacterized protein LOC128307424 [Anopheles moucheti]